MEITPNTFEPGAPPIVVPRSVPIEPPPVGAAAVRVGAVDSGLLLDAKTQAEWGRRRHQRAPLVKRAWTALGARIAAMAQPAKVHDPLRPQGKLDRILGATPPWLVSTVVHASIILILGWIAVEAHQEVAEEMSVALAPIEEFTDDDVFAEKLGQQLEIPNDLPNNELVTEFDPTYSHSALPEVEDPLSAPGGALDLTGEGTSFFSDITAPSIGNALTGRQEGRKEALMASYGGTRTTQEAVLLALAWLARNQGRDGAWSLMGPYEDGSARENKPAATAMAMLAFLGDGHTHMKDGPFRRNVQRGIKALLKFQNKEGFFVDNEVQAQQQLYTHAQCTIALCELYAITDSSALREPAQRAVEYCVKIQAPEGGWRYFPFQDADTSVTGWFVMALQSARMAKLDVPKEALDRVGGFLDSVESHGGERYAYQPQRVDTVAMTAEALLCRQYLGWYRHDPRLTRAVEFLGDYPVDWGKRDVYYWYYATQVMHHVGGQPWVKWNRVMRQELPEHQVRSGRLRGSWDPDGDAWGNTAGRLYTTCLSTYMLEVYYRHLPLYGAAEKSASEL